MSNGAAQYIIDVASQVDGADKTLDELDAISAKLTGTARGATTFDAALVKLSNSLTAAGSASKAANAALAEAETQYSALEKAALQAAKAEEKAAALGVVPPDIAAKAAAAASAVNAYSKTLKGLEDAAAKAKTEETALEQTLKNAQTIAQHTAALDDAKEKAAKKAADEQAKAAAAAETATRQQDAGIKRLKGALPALGGAFGQVGGQVAGAIDDFGDLSEVFGEGGASAIVASGGISILVVALAALVVGLAAGTIAVASWAVGLADSNRELDLTSQAFVAFNPQVAAVSSTIDELHSALGETTPALQSMAKSLVDAHVSAADLPEALKAAAIAAAALGQGGANEFVARINAGTKSVHALAKETEASLGGIAAQRVLGLTEQTAKLKDEISGLFGELDIDPVLKGFQTIVGLFDETTAAGQTMKFLFNSVFQPLIDDADKAATVVEGFVLGFLIGLTKLYIALKPVVKAVSEFLGEHDPSLTNILADVTSVGEELAPVFVALVVGFTAAAAIVGVLVGVSLALFAAFVALPAVVIGAVVGIGAAIFSAIGGAIDYLESIDLGTIGNALIQGLIAGITGAAGALISSITGVVSGGIDAAKAVLGIHSPSKVFEGIGDDTVAGFTGAVDDGTDDAQNSLTSLVSPLAAQDTAAAPPSGGSSSKQKAGGSSLDLSGSTFNFYGVKDAENAKQSFREMFLELIEGNAATMGQDPEPA